VLRKSLATYKKKIDANHHILFSYDIAIEHLEFLVDENVLEFFEDAIDLIKFIILQFHLKIDNRFSIGFNQSFFHDFDSPLSIIKTNYQRKEHGLLKVFTQFDSEKTSFNEIEVFSKKHNLNNYTLGKDLVFITDIQIDCEILDFSYV